MLCIEAALNSIPDEILQGCCVLFCHLERRQPRKPTPLRALSVTHPKTASHTGFGTSVSLPAASLRLYCTYRLASRRGFFGGERTWTRCAKSARCAAQAGSRPGTVGCVRKPTGSQKVSPRQSQASWFRCVDETGTPGGHKVQGASCGLIVNVLNMVPRAQPTRIWRPFTVDRVPKSTTITSKLPATMPAPVSG